MSSDADKLKADIQSSFRAARPDDPTEPCPTAADIVVVELQEVIRRGKSRRFAAPTARTQYVNLDVADDPGGEQPEVGRAIVLRARVEWKRGKRGTFLGKTVYWFSRGRDDNRKNLVGAVRSGFDTVGSGTVRTTTRVGADGWTEECTFWLSRYGGDIFEVFATESPLCKKGIQAGPYSVWRRLYFDVTEMKREHGGHFTLSSAAIERAREVLADSFIDFSDLGDRNTAPFRQNFPDYAERFIWADQFCTNKKSPQKTHVCMVNRIDTRAQATAERAEDVATTVSFTSTTTIDPYTDDGSWLIIANYRVEGDARLYTLPNDNSAVTLVGSGNGPRHFKVDFSVTTLHPSPQRPITISLLYRKRSSIAGDSSNRAHVFVALGDIEQRTTQHEDLMVGETVAHEIGHQLGLVHDLPWSARQHPEECKFPACLMWWESASNLRSAALGFVKPLFFHHEDVSDPGCRTFVRQKDMSKSGLNSVFRFPR